ncbi:hypothetical protein ACLB2K_002555 [Fragaria x ananassa]
MGSQSMKVRRGGLGRDKAGRSGLARYKTGWGGLARDKARSDGLAWDKERRPRGAPACPQCTPVRHTSISVPLSSLCSRTHPSNSSTPLSHSHHHLIFSSVDDRGSPVIKIGANLLFFFAPRDSKDILFIVFVVSLDKP